MTWLEALHIHMELGHKNFKEMALLKDKWPVFIKNVCTHIGCKEN